MSIVINVILIFWKWNWKISRKVPKFVPYFDFHILMCEWLGLKLDICWSWLSLGILCKADPVLFSAVKALQCHLSDSQAQRQIMGQDIAVDPADIYLQKTFLWKENLLRNKRHVAVYCAHSGFPMQSNKCFLCAAELCHTHSLSCFSSRLRHILPLDWNIQQAFVWRASHLQYLLDTQQEPSCVLNLINP